VIGSGATAITLVPSLAASAAHVTMLQRSPSYVALIPEQDVFANAMRRYLPAKLAYRLSRWKNILLNMFIFTLAKRHPKVIKKNYETKQLKRWVKITMWINILSSAISLGINVCVPYPITIFSKPSTEVRRRLLPITLKGSHHRASNYAPVKNCPPILLSPQQGCNSIYWVLISLASMISHLMSAPVIVTKA
jgi:hypothetical protein